MRDMMKSDSGTGTVLVENVTVTQRVYHVVPKFTAIVSLLRLGR